MHSRNRIQRFKNSHENSSSGMVIELSRAGFFLSLFVLMRQVRLGFAVNIDAIFDTTSQCHRIMSCDVDVYYLAVPTPRTTPAAGAPDVCTLLTSLVMFNGGCGSNCHRIFFNQISSPFKFHIPRYFHPRSLSNISLFFNQHPCMLQ